MSIIKLENKNIAILGLGVENIALIDFLLKKKIDCNISIFDSRSAGVLGEKYSKYRNRKNIYWNLSLYKNDFSGFDIIFRSPGWPLFDRSIDEAKSKNKNIIISSAMNLFFELSPTKNIIGVTGTKGKGTTSSLIYEIIKASGRKVFLGGNIGIAPFTFFNKIKKSDWVVLELSSFQLEDLKHSPQIAVFTNFYKEHLAPADPNNPNYHKSLKAYWEAKANIFRYQKDNDKLIVNINLAKRLEKEPVTGERMFFNKSELDSKLIGEHNKENIAAALDVSRILKIKLEVIEDVLKKFRGLEHRLEFVKKIDGVQYYNDSFATTPESTITALKSFNSSLVMFLGGADKGSDFKALAREVKKRVSFIILFKGVGSVKIKKELIAIGFDKKSIRIVNSMSSGFSLIKEFIKKGDTVLLSTACASFGVFKNYKERGKLFKEEVKKI